ncbi:MAG: hypothetical protein FWF06_05490 [Symbiobacteriaceae bacterium]|nr:hypothetical protein [Symbiobacteriaceae bacterium]
MSSIYPADYPVTEGEFWTARQRQMSPLHEISYRACFKAELPAWFIQRYTQEGEVVYDPFAGRGTTAVQASIMGRRFISNDINPLARILAEPRISPPPLAAIARRLEEIDLSSPQGREKGENEPDLEAFFNLETLQEVRNLRSYLHQRRVGGREDTLDAWIRMVATNRLTGHSKGFFSVYTLPPNLATSPERQRKINAKYNNDFSVYKNVKEIIFSKSRLLLKEEPTGRIGTQGIFLSCDAGETLAIPEHSVKLVVTSPPFLTNVQYDADNWLRLWFNCLDVNDLKAALTQTPHLAEWQALIRRTFAEFRRILTHDGWGAFEVGEIQKGRLRLDEVVFQLLLETGLLPQETMVNSQKFSKTSNIWGISNNTQGTNSNRIVLFRQGL